MSAHVSDWQQGPECGGEVARDRVAGRSAAVHATRLAARIWRPLRPVLLRLWSRVEARRATQRSRSLRVLETVGMGEKRFIAIVQVQQARFLIGGGSAGVSLLARLDQEQEFAAVLDEQASAPGSPLPSLAAKHIGEAW